jgi:hypothetical protein
MTERHLRAIFDKTHGHCHFCGDPVRFERRGWNERGHGYWEVDHTIQRHKGGGNRVDNYLPACTRCNRLRWHRKGRELREIIFLGLLAQKQIKRKSGPSRLGRELLELKARRLAENKRRRVPAVP